MSSNGGNEIWTVHGGDGDDFYIDDDTRVCLVCNTPKKLIQFYKRGKPGTKNHKVHMACMSCVRVEEKNSLAKQESDVSSKLVGALSKATGRSAKAAELAPLLSTTLRAMSDSWGGDDETAKKLASITQRAMDSGDPELALRAVRMMLDSMARSQKMTPDPIDISSLSTDDLRDVLLEPAKQLILEDEQFRAELLNMPDVRRALLGDAGVDVYDADSFEAMINSGSGDLINADTN